MANRDDSNRRPNRMGGNDGSKCSHEESSTCPNCGGLRGEGAVTTAIKHIREIGWADHAVKNEPPFNYTSGIHGFTGYGDYVIVGLGPKQAHITLCEFYANYILKGIVPEDRDELWELGPLPVIARVIPVRQEIWDDWFELGQRIAARLYGNPIVPMTQLCWPDERAKYPWEEDYNRNMWWSHKFLGDL